MQSTLSDSGTSAIVDSMNGGVDVVSLIRLEVELKNSQQVVCMTLPLPFIYVLIILLPLSFSNDILIDVNCVYGCHA